MFQSNYEHQIDQKGRIRIPAKFKAEIGNNYTIIKGDSRCLSFLPENVANEVFSKLSKVPASNKEAYRAVRNIMSSAFTPEEDNQGRFILPQDLRAFIGADKQIIFVGMVDHFELWSKEHWKEYLGDSVEQSFDDNIAALAEYGF